MPATIPFEASGRELVRQKGGKAVRLNTCGDIVLGNAVARLGEEMQSGDIPDKVAVLHAIRA